MANNTTAVLEINLNTSELAARLASIAASLLEEFSQLTGQASGLRDIAKSLTALADIPASNEAAVPFISPVAVSCPAAEKTTSDHVALCDTLSAGELSKRYRREWNCHRNMLHRRNRTGAVIAPEFKTFASFLRYVGPMPAQLATIDRIDNNNPRYGPGLVRWADKRTQNANKGDSLLFFYSRTGETYTTTRLAGLQKVSADTIRHRRKRGWTDDQIIEGSRVPEAQPLPKPTSASSSVSTPYASSVSFAKMQAEKRAALDYAHDRQRFEEYGAAAILAPIEVLYDGSCPSTPLFDDLNSKEQERLKKCWDRRFAAAWPSYRPHVEALGLYDELPERAKAVVIEIETQKDPGFLSKLAAKKVSKDACAAALSCSGSAGPIES